MPLLQKKPFSRISLPDDIDDNEKVFYCSATQEAFTDYEAFFDRVVLCSSTVWSCSVTGRSGLTFQEALDSEANANSMLNSFPEYLQLPVLYLMTFINEHKLSSIVDMITVFVTNRYFVGEEVGVIVNDRKIKGRIVRVLSPTEKELRDSKMKCEEVTVSYGCDPSLFKYEVEDIMENGIKVVVGAERVTRPKATISKDKLRLFLKQHITAEKRFKAMKLNESTIKQFHIEETCWNDIFAGPLPNFESDTLIVRTFNKDKAKAAKNKREEDEDEGIRNFANKNKLSKRKDLIQTINTTNVSKNKRSLEDVEKQKEILKQQKLEKKLEREKLKEEMKQREKEWNKKRDDMECDDLQPLPIATPIKCSIPSDFFGQTVMIMEFFFNFNELFHITKIFPHGINFEVMEKIITENDIYGPFGDVVEILLRTIFTLQEEENRLPVAPSTDSCNSDDDDENDERPVNDELQAALKAASVSSLIPVQCHGIPLNQMDITAFTVTEILRLHILSSGVGRYKCNQRGWISGKEDPCFWLKIKNPDLVKKLSCRTIFELHISDRLELLDALINQVLSFVRFRDFVEEAFEKVMELKKQLRTLERNLRLEKSEKQNSSKEVGEDENADVKVEELSCGSNIRSKRKIDDLKLQIRNIEACSRLKPIGYDRWCRKYWWFSSLNGLFLDYEDVKICKCSSQCSSLYNLASKSKCFVTLQDMKHNALRNVDMSSYLTSDDRSTASDKENDCVTPPKSVHRSEVESLNFPKPSLYHINVNGKNYCVPVSADTHSDVKWSFFHRKEDIEALISNLNNRGFRESELKKKLENERFTLIESMKECPAHILNKDLPEQFKSKKILHKRSWNKAFAELPPDEAVVAAFKHFTLEIEEKLFDGGLCVIESRYDWRNKFMDQSSLLVCAELVISLAKSIFPQFLQSPLAEENGTFERWQESILTCTSFSQLFVYLNTLEKSILWSKAASRAFCRICRKRGNADCMLLCDECNSGHHTYCLQPPLDEIPVGEWYCSSCVKSKPLSPRKVKQNEVHYKEVSSEEENDEVYNDDSDVETSDSISVNEINKDSFECDKCAICSANDCDVTCQKCGLQYHSDCHSPPLLRSSRRNWCCSRCTSNSNTTKNQEITYEQRPKRQRSSRYDEDFDYKSGILIDPKENNQSEKARRSQSRNLPLNYAKCRELLVTLTGHKDSWPFLEAPKSKEAPNYNNIVKRHMDFGLVFTKLDTGAYKSNIEVVADIYLLLQNSWVYWPRTSKQYCAGKRLYHFLQQHLSKIGFDDLKECVKIP